MKNAHRTLLGLASLLLAAGGLAHAAAFERNFARIASTELPSFHPHAYKAFWLMGSSTLLILALVLAW